jgi:hypothetical protein
MLRLSSTSALCALALMAAPASAAAQEPDWNSEQNRTWWNGVTEAELRELTAEAGGTWTDLPDAGTLRHSRIDWPGLPAVMVSEGNCPASEPERPMPERNCGNMILSVAVDQPADIEAWWHGSDGWLAFGRAHGVPALYRIEHSAFGTTRGRVLSTLMLFRNRAVEEIGRMPRADDSGW